MEIGEVQWPIPARMLIPPLANLGFEGETLLMREVTVPSDYQGQTLEFSSLAQWLVCREVCIPGEANLSLRVAVDADAALRDGDLAAYAEKVAEAQSLIGRAAAVISAEAGG